MTVFFALSGSERAKAAHKTLVKLTPGLNFAYILQAAFPYLSVLISFYVFAIWFAIFYRKEKLFVKCLKLTDYMRGGADCCIFRVICWFHFENS